MSMLYWQNWGLRHIATANPGWVWLDMNFIRYFNLLEEYILV